MSIKRRVRDPFSGHLVDPRQLMFDLLPCAVAGVSNGAVLSPPVGLEVSRDRSGRICRPRPGGPYRPALWPVYWVPPGTLPPVGDADYVRVSVPWR